jgi:hypothetical protein
MPLTADAAKALLIKIIKHPLWMHLLLIGNSIIFGYMYVCVQPSLQQIPPALFTWVRSIVTLATLLPVTLLDIKFEWPRNNGKNPAVLLRLGDWMEQQAVLRFLYRRVPSWFDTCMLAAAGFFVLVLN